MELRGTRYLEGVSQDDGTLSPPVRPAIAKFFEKHLHKLSFEHACLFYALKVPSMNQAERALLGCNDRFFLLAHILRRPDVIHPWLFARCREVEADPDGYLDLWAREHYKSTVITFAGSIQEICINPEITIAIFGGTDKIAMPFLSQVQTELERNETLQDTYCDVFWKNPKTEAPTWSLKDGLTVKRQTNPKEATLSAFGLIDGMPTGGHWLLRIYDDIINEKLVTNPEQILKATERWELSDNLGAGKNRAWHIGTRYHFADFYGVILERGVCKERIYPATDNGKVTGNPVFFSQEKWLEKVKTQRSVLAAQMLQNPLAGKENTFETKWLNGFIIRPRTLNILILCDPSKGKTKVGTQANRSDRTAIAVIGVDANLNKYLLDGYRHRMPLSERWKKIRDLHKKWSNAPGIQSVRVGYERYGQQTDDEHFEQQMRRENYRFDLEEVAWVREGGQSKKERIAKLEPEFRASNFYVPGKIYHPDLGNCTWSIDNESGKILYHRITGELRQEAKAKFDGEKYRLMEPIRRLDEDANIYDLTRSFFEEYRLHPFGTHEDLIDAMSRHFDMEDVTGPIVFEQGAELAPQYAD